MGNHEVTISEEFANRLLDFLFFYENYDEGELYETLSSLLLKEDADDQPTNANATT